jgi:hypothetical protein
LFTQLRQRVKVVEYMHLEAMQAYVVGTLSLVAAPIIGIAVGKFSARP